MATVVNEAIVKIPLQNGVAEIRERRWCVVGAALAKRAHRLASNFDPVRSRTNVCKRMRNADSATYLVWALLMRRKVTVASLRRLYLAIQRASRAEREAPCIDKSCVI